MLADDRRSWQLQPDATWVPDRDTSRAGRARSTRSRCSRRTPSRTGSVVGRPAPTRRRRRLAGPAGMSARPVDATGRGRAEVPGRRPGRRRALPRRRGDRRVQRHRPRRARRSSRTATSTPRDGALARAGFAVRLRQPGSGTIVSVKSLGRTEGPGGSIRREELEGPGRPDRRARSTGRRRTPARWSSSRPATRRSSSS